MSKQEEISNAISAHVMWKTKLRKGIAAGKLETPVNDIRVDNKCAFGKWLSELSLADRSSPEAKKIKALHAAFHQAAAQIAERINAGKLKEAEHLLDDPHGDFVTTSLALIAALMDWKKQP